MKTINHVLPETFYLQMIRDGLSTFTVSDLDAAKLRPWGYIGELYGQFYYLREIFEKHGGMLPPSAVESLPKFFR